MKTFLATLFVLLSGALTPFISIAQAEVLDSNESGFIIEMSATVEQSQEASYQQFMRVNEWWDGNHSWFGSADNFVLEAKVGGCFCEIKGKQQALHMTVSFINPNEEVRMLGGLGPLQMMGVHGAMSFKFEAINDTTTKITHRYVVTGFSGQKLNTLAPIVDQVQAGQLARLVKKLTPGTKTIN